MKIYDSEFVRENGWIYVKLAGKIISSQSTIEEISFEQDKFRKIKIFGDYNLYEGEFVLSRNDNYGDVFDYYSNLIRGERIEHFRFKENSFLEIEIDRNPKIRLIIDPENFDLWGDQWEYQNRNGYWIF